jgi:GH43 family beta-xylosidase
VSEAEYRRVVNRLLPLANTGLRRVESSGEAELLYGDGSSRRMPARREPWPFPLMGERGDPMAIRYRGRYYFMATDDEGGQLALKIREAASLGEIAGAEESVLLSARSEAEGCFWAPELHEIGGRLFLFFAVGSPHWYTVQCHAMALEGTDPTDPAAWSKPRRCVTREGKPLYEGGITLDMSVLDTKAGYYAVWARREIGEDLGDLGPSDLYIARIDPREPWRLASEAVLLRRPSYAWERAHSEVAEGPFLLKRGGELFLTYAAALIDHSYCVGLLRAKDGDELLEAASWSASNYPVLHRQSVPDQIGAGHNSFVKDEAGEDVLMIHAIPFAHYRNNPQDLRRYPAFRRVHWDAEGFPRLDMTPERELAPEVARLAAANPAREGDEG